MTPEEVRQIIREELAALFNKSDRFIFEKNLQFLDGRTIQVGLTNGLKIGTAITQKIGFWNKTPVVQPSSTGEATGFTAGAGTTATHLSTFTGNSGSTAYNVGDIVKHLKAIGILLS